jgi:hypothetical protein
MPSGPSVAAIVAMRCVASAILSDAGARISSVDHGVHIWIFGSEDKIAKVCPTTEHPTNDLAIPREI